MFILPGEAYEKLKQANVQFVDCRFDLSDPDAGREAYLHAHIPGAVYFDLENDLSGPVQDGGEGGRHPLPDWNEFTEKLGEQGIDRDTTLILYDSNHAFASRMYWMLKLIGHKDMYILEGGFEAWKDHGSPTESGPVKKNRVDYGEIQLNSSMMVNQEVVKEKLNDPNVVLVDSRAAKRYSGEFEPIDRKAGHIPGAVNYEWDQLFTDGKFKNTDELKKHYEDIDPEKEVIVYCGSGVTATPNVLALQQAGYSNVKLYPGSFSDWVSNDSNPVDKGK